jgi:hypothetical protein
MMVSDSGDQIADPGPHQHTDPGAQGADTGPNNEQYSFIRVLKLLSWISTNHIPYTIRTTLAILGIQHTYPTMKLINTYVIVQKHINLYLYLYLCTCNMLCW